MSSTPDESVTDTVVVDEKDTFRGEMLELLQRELGDAVVGSEISGGDIWVRVRTDAWKRAAEVCRDQMACDYFCFLSGIDWSPNPDMSGEKVHDPGASPTEVPDFATGVAGGDSRFQVFARLYSTSRKAGITLKADVDSDNPRVESWTSLYAGADWHERETWEMYGFDFEGHPGLRHLYLPAEFEGHPLRKDFPLLAREVKPWPGLVDVEPIPGSGDDEEAVQEQPTEGGES